MKFIDFYNEHPYSNMILEDSTEEKIQLVYSKSPADRRKRCIGELEDYANPSIRKYIFSLPRYIDSSISAECLKAKS